VVAAVVAIVVMSRPQKSAGAFGPIDDIPCRSEVTTYHEHAHLTMINRGHPIALPAGIGIRDAHRCVYWLHTHASNGIIHIEAPRTFVPTLGTFFDVWGQPLSRRQIWNLTVGAGESMQVYVGRQIYKGDPRLIPLRPYTDMTIEIGPPFVPPKKYNFNGY
jgi:hypothetical protein